MTNSPETRLCPVCDGSNTIFVAERENLITMQNYVYHDYDEARRAQVGRFELRACRDCGFVYNGAFDSSLLSYDENYDNAVPSEIFLDYYKEIARFLYDKFSLENQLVIDVGCGKGTLLKVLCGMYPAVQGIGIDPSYEPDNSNELTPNLKFIQDVFKAEYIDRKPALIICRHVLEHIAQPVLFLKSITDASSDFDKTPFFIEVPDLEWIIQNNVFWDFCYEHCNYFTAHSLRKSLDLSGFKVEHIQNAFGGQYLWSWGKIEQNGIETPAGDNVIDSLISYAAAEKDLISKTKSKLEELKKNADLIAVWGMSTKGVVLCNLVDPEKRLFDYCIDINPKKDKCLVPHTGHQIDSPEKLAEAGQSNLVVIVMNPNYLDEIEKDCRNMKLKARFIDADDLMA